MPGTIVSDNGAAFTSMAILKWVQEAGVDWHYIAPEKTNPNRMHRKLQRQAQGRIPERNALQLAGRSQGNAGSMAGELQPLQTTFIARKSDTDRICSENEHGQTGRITP